MNEIQRLVCYKYPTKYLKNGRYEETKGYKSYKKKPKHEKKKYKKPVQFVMDKKGDRKQIGPKNKDKEQWDSISGQAVYTGMHNRLRTNMVLFLKDYFRTIIREQLRPVKESEYPIKISCELHTTTNRKWDASNMWIYGKVLEDTLVDEGVITDDSNKYVTLPPTAPFVVPIDDWEKRKIVFKFNKDTRKVFKHDNT